MSKTLLYLLLFFFPSNTPSDPTSSSSFNLLMTTWHHGTATSSPPALPKPADLRLGLIWTLCHPVSIHLPPMPHSFHPTSRPLLYQRGFGLKSFTANPHSLCRVFAANCNFSSRTMSSGNPSADTGRTCPRAMRCLQRIFFVLIVSSVRINLKLGICRNVLK